MNACIIDRKKTTVANFNRFIFVLVLLSVGLISCKSSQMRLERKIQVNVTQNDQTISFEIINTTGQVVEFPNTKQFIISKKENGSWSTVPTYPCVCGVPCGNPGVPVKISNGESVTVEWDYISRKCKGGEATEYKIGAGEYKFLLTYKLIEDGVISTPGTLKKEFAVAD